MSYEAYLKASAPAYMQDQYGQAWLGGIGAAMDDYAQEYIAGVLAAFPDYAPFDALGIIGDELGIDRGRFETDLQYAARLRNAWQAWKLAGSPLGVLTALYWAGFPGAVLVQQNGLAYSLSGDLTAGADATAALVTTQCSTLPSVLTSSVAPYRTIPAGTPWFAFDSNTDFCSRFAVIFPAPLGQAFLWSQVQPATFNNADSAAVTWDQAVQFASYQTIAGGAIVTDGSPDGPSVWVDGTTQTSTGVTIRSSAPFTGTVWASAFPALNVADQARLKATIKKWKPAKATCVGVYAIQSGEMWDWPLGLTWDGDSNTWDGSVVSTILGSF